MKNNLTKFEKYVQRPLQYSLTTLILIFVFRGFFLVYELTNNKWIMPILLAFLLVLYIKIYYGGALKND